MKNISYRRNFRFPLIGDNESVVREKTSSRVLFEHEPDTLLSSLANSNTNGSDHRVLKKNKRKETFNEEQLINETDNKIGGNSLQKIRKEPARSYTSTSYYNVKKPEVKKTQITRSRKPYRPSIHSQKGQEVNYEYKSDVKAKHGHQPSYKVNENLGYEVTTSHKNIWRSAELAKQLMDNKKSYILLDTVNILPMSIDKDASINMETEIQLDKMNNDDTLPKKNRLEKSLSGIMDEEQSQLRANKYFS